MPRPIPTPATSAVKPADPLLLLLVKALASAIVLCVGFRAVSDDDFARVVLAESWAASPKLDPTGTSWLPFPFWITGSAMLALGRSVFVARLVAFALGLGSAVLVWLAARRIASSRAGALLGAACAAILPWSARLGVATVPELPTAALGLFALGTLVGPDERGRARLAGGLSLVVATLSRYDVWPLGAAFSVLTALDVWKDRRGPRSQRILFVAAIVLSLLGPALWIAWNQFSRGSALDFLERVSAYKRALGGSGDEARLGRLFAYPLAMVRHEPEIFSALFILLGLGATSSLRRFMVDALRPYARPLAITLLQVAALSAALIKDGAPTHHPERALLVLLLLVSVLVGDLATVLWPRASMGAKKATLVAAAVLLSLSLLIVRRWFRAEGFTPRTDEVALGEASRALVSPGERILVDVVDYGHFAFTAGFGRPEDVELDRDIDPRKPKVASSFEDPAALKQKLEDPSIRWIVAKTSWKAVSDLGPPKLISGDFGLWPAEMRKQNGQ